MRRFFGGGRPSPEEQQLHGQDPTLVQAMPPTPEVLLDNLEPQLEESRLTWRGVANYIKEMAEDELALARVEGLVDETIRREVAPDKIGIALRDLPRVSANIYQDYVSLTATRARFMAEATSKERLSIGRLAPVDDHVRGIYFRLNSSRFLDNLQDLRSLPNQMGRGVEVHRQIINGVGVFMGASPEAMGDLVALSRQTKDEPDPRLVELRKVVSVDWHLPEGASRLRAHIDALAADPSLSEAAFLKAIAETEQRKKEYESIRRMAQFAIAASGGDIESAEAIQKVMHEARPQWDAFPEIQGAFSAFHRERIERLRRDVGVFVDEPHRTIGSIRYPRTEADVRGALDKLGGSLYATAAQRSAAEKRSGARRGVLSVDELTREAEVLSEPLGMGFVKQALDGQRVVEPVESVDEIIKSSKIPDEVKAEVKRMLEVIALDPKGQGTKQIKTGISGLKVVIDGKMVPSRRFSPSERTGFTTTKAARRYRVVYIVHEDTIGVIDILHHDDFDDKYSISG